MGEAVAPSTATVIYEHERYLSFPAIAACGGRLLVVFRIGAGNPLDHESRIVVTESDDDGRSWSPPRTWMEVDGCDARNCGGGTLADGSAHFVFDLHHRDGWRRPHVRFTRDGRDWSEPVWLDANEPDGAAVQLTSVANRGIPWPDGRLYFPCFRGRSVLLDRADGRQEQHARVPRHEPAIDWSRRGELVSFSKGGVVDVSADRGATWMAAGDVDSISQPDLLQLRDRRLLLCWSGKLRLDEWLAVSEDGHDVYDISGLRIFAGTDTGVLDSRGKAMALERDTEILTVLYEAAGAGGPSRIYLVRTPKTALSN